MKALVYHGPGTKSWEDVPEPSIVKPTDAIVKVDTTTICGTDLHILKGDVPAVTEGRVLVLREQRVLGLPTAPKPVARTLVAGERVLVDGRTARISKLTTKEIDQTLQWTTGRITFHEEKLSDVVRELNRYNARQLVVLDSRAAGTRIGGGFDTSHADTYAEDLIRFFGPKALGALAASE